MITGFEKSGAGLKIKAPSGVTEWELLSSGAFRGRSTAAAGVSSYVTVTLTGWWAQAADGSIYFQTTGGEYVDTAEGWEKAGQETHSQADAQSYVDKMIKNNKRILENNLLCARYAGKLSASEKKTLYNLQTRLQERNQQLIDDGLVSGIKTSEAYGYQYLDQYLVSFMNTGGIGVVISTTTAIIIGAVVVAALSTAAYFAYKALYNESASDVKFSDELTKTLVSKLTEEEYNQLMKETAGILTKEKILSKFSGAGDLVKYALLAAGAYFIYKFVKGRKE